MIFKEDENLNGPSLEQTTVPEAEVSNPKSTKVHSQPTTEIHIHSDSTKPSDDPEKNQGAMKSSTSEMQVGDTAQKATGLSQEELVQMAFADDDVNDEFEKEKTAEVSHELPKVEEISLLPGWGRWKDEQQEPKWMQEKRAKSTRLPKFNHLGRHVLFKDTGEGSTKEKRCQKAFCLYQ